MNLDSKISDWDERPLARAALLLLAFAVLWPYRHFAGDDAYITFRFAENLAAGHGFSFNLDQPTYGSTSPLWVFLLAAAAKLGFSIPAAAHFFDAGFILLTLVTFNRLCSTLIRSPALRLIAAVLLLVDPWFVRWTMSGMECPAALFFICATFLARLRARTDTKAAWLAPVWCGLGLLTRPEFAVVGLLVALDIFLFEKEKRLARLLALAVIAGLLLLPWLIYAQHNFGTVLPNTMLAKIGASRAAGLRAILKYFATFYIAEALGLLFLLALSARLCIEAAQQEETRRRWFLPVGWGLALPAFYLAGAAPISARYLFMGLPAYILIGIKSWELLIEWKKLPLPRVLIGILTVCALVSAAAVQARYCWYVTQWPEGMDPRMVELGRSLHGRAAPGDVIATDQIGTVGYYSGRPILDLAGLISPELRRYSRLGDGRALWQYVHQQSPQWLLVAPSQAARLAEFDPAYRELVLEETLSVQREGASDAGNKSTYLLYKTGWPQR